MTSLRELAYYLEITIGCVLILIYLRLNTIRTIKNARGVKMFNVVLESSMLLCLFDFGWAVCEMLAPMVPILVTKVVNAFYFCTTALVCFTWMIYSEHIQGNDSKDKIWIKILLGFPAVIVVVMSFASIWTEWFFGFDEAGHYFRGKYHFIQVLGGAWIGIITSIKAFYVAAVTKDKMRRKECLAILGFVIWPVIAEVIQILVIDVPALSMGVAIGCLSIFMNIQNKIRINTLKEERDMAEAANRAKSDFLANMSHEIRTPINAVLGLNEVILRETKEAETRRMAIDIHSATKGLLAIINDILDYTKIESGRMVLVPVEYSLSELLSDVTAMMMPRLKNKPIKLILDADINLPRMLHGDEVRVRQVLTNLITNAIKYTNEGTITVKITGNRFEEDGESKILLYFSVADTGIGIRDEDLSLLFEKFKRIEQQRNRNIEGTGLGLNITSNILALMDSTLDVKSEYGVGSTFSFEIEQKIVGETLLGDVSVFTRISDGTDYNVVFTAPEAKVLVVDDNAMNRNVIIRLLKPTAVKITEAESGDAALERLAHEHFDCVFLDHMMPGMDGIECLERFHKGPYPLNENTPVIALTANAVSGAREMFLEKGFDGYISKPVDGETLEKALFKYLPKDKVSEGAPVEQDESEDHLPEIEGLNTVEASKYAPTVEEYVGSLSMYLDEYEEKVKALSNALDMKDWKSYKINAHTIKSTSRLIGAMELGDFAFEFEKAAGQENESFISSNHAKFIDDYTGICDIVKAAIDKLNPKDNVVKLKAMSVDELASAIERLKAGLGEYDIDIIREVTDDLLASDILLSVKNKLEKALASFDYDGIGTAIKELDFFVKKD